MLAWVHWGTSLILTLQQIPWLTGLMQALTYLGNTGVQAVAVLYIVWCVNYRLGARLLAVLILSAGLNALLKVAFHLPRPYWVDTRVLAISQESSYGLPSGHAMNTLVLAGYVAARSRRGWAWALAAAVVLLVSLSRLSLGVHSPADVLAGWTFGALLLGLLVAGEPRLEAWLRARAPREQLVLSALAAVLYLALYWGLLAALVSRPDPALWERNAAAAHAPAAGLPAINPRDPENALFASGALMGLGVAFILGRPRGWQPARALTSRLRCLLVGLLGALGCAVVVVVRISPAFLAVAVHWLGYAMLVPWVLYQAPVSFGSLGLIRD